MNDQISRQKLIEELEWDIAHWQESVDEYHDKEEIGVVKGLRLALERIGYQPPSDQWIPVTYRETTEEERECGIEWKYILDCPLPDNDTEILVCTKAGSVWTDTFFNDDGCYLDGGYDLTEIAAWQPLPKPYKGE